MLSIALCIPLNIPAEVIQLIDVDSYEKSDWNKQYSDKDLEEIQKIKSHLITFVKSSQKSQLKLLSSKYKDVYKNTEKVLSATFDKEAYLKIDFRKIEYLNKDRATIKANVYWTSEGYEGLQTFYFMLVKQNEKWLVDWMVQ